MSSSLNLTKREQEVLEVLAQGMSNKMIANALSISENTVEQHLRNMYGKLGVSCRVAACRWYWQKDQIREKITEIRY